MATITLSVQTAQGTTTATVNATDAGVNRALTDLAAILPGVANAQGVLNYALAQLVNRGKAAAVAYERQQTSISPLT